MPKIVKKTAAAGLTGKLKKTGPVVQKRAGPVWLGPQDSSQRGGITQSMLWKFLGCRERFRLRYIEGLKPTQDFSKVMEYGQMWHTCEEALAAQRDWLKDLQTYCNGLLRRYPMHQEEINKWYQVCQVQFPIYVDYWSKQKDVVERTPLMQEHVFHVPYTLPSGRVVYLRGKFDSVDLIGKGRNAGIYLQENKTKGDVDEQKLTRQLSFDLQTMLYLVALDGTPLGAGDGYPVRGVRYNVIRRPLSGGKGSIKQLEATQGSKCPKCKGEKKIKQAMGRFNDPMIICPKCNGDGRIGAKPGETSESYYNRLREIIQGDVDKEEGDYWFLRHRVEISQADVEAFKSQCLNPILEQLCDWYNYVIHPVGPNWIHWRHPFGGYNVLDEGGATELDEYLRSGSELGLTRSDELFTELQ